MLPMFKVNEEVKDVLLAWVQENAFPYYRSKFESGEHLNDIIRDASVKNELAILRVLVEREFPQHNIHLLKYLLIQ